jgi:LAS superfamily LD-carboxypeptidase LdcB
MVQPDKDEKGDWILYDKGKAIGSAKMTLVDWKPVISTVAPIILKMKEDAKKAGITLILNSGYRPWSAQYAIRKSYVIDKTKIADEDYLITQPSSKFSPVCAPPGFSNHQDGMAYDFKVKDDPTTKDVDESKAYKWLVDNAITYGMIRTVGSERWHWEYRPGVDKFAKVPKTHPTWDGLA